MAGVALCGTACLAGRRIDAPAAQALVLLLVFPMLAATMRPIALPDQGEQLARRLHALGVGRGPVLLFGESATAGKTRVASAGTIDIRPAEGECAARMAECESNGDLPAALVLPRERIARLDDAEWDVRPGSQGYRSMDVAELLVAAGRGELRDFFERHRSELFIALRRPHR